MLLFLPILIIFFCPHFFDWLRWNWMNIFCKGNGHYFDPNFWPIYFKGSLTCHHPTDRGDTGPLVYNVVIWENAFLLYFPVLSTRVKWLRLESNSSLPSDSTCDMAIQKLFWLDLNNLRLDLRLGNYIFERHETWPQRLDTSDLKTTLVFSWLKSFHCQLYI